MEGDRRHGDRDVNQPNPWKTVLQFAMCRHLGERAAYFDLPGVVDEVVNQLGYLDPGEIDPLVLEEILDHNRKSL